MVADLAENQAFLAGDGVLYGYFTGRCHTANILALRAQTEALLEGREGRVSVLLFVDTPATIGARGRKATTDYITAMRGRIAVFVLCLDATLVWRSMFRSAVAGGLILSKKDYQVAIATDLAETARHFTKAGVHLDMNAAAHAQMNLRHAVKRINGG